MKKILCFLLIILLLSTAAACKKDNGPALLTACIAGEPASMDPGLFSDADTVSYLSHIFEGLTATDQKSDIVPGTAVNWTISPDGTVYTFSIRPEAKWSDGKPVTASNFLYAWQRLVDPSLEADFSYLAYCIKNAQRIHFGELPMNQLGVEALNASTLRVTLEGPCSYFLSLVSTPAFFPVREDIIRSNPDWSLDPPTCIGNGPFVLNEWLPRDSMTLVKNPHYWNQPAIANIDLQFFFMTDPEEIYRAFKKKDLLFAVNIPASSYAAAKKDKTLTQQNIQATHSLLFNTTKKPYDDPRIRKALSLAIDRDYLAKSIWSDERKPAGAFVPPGVPDVAAQSKSDFRTAGGDYFDPGAGAFSANLEEARSLLAEAGFENGAGFPEITLFIDDSQTSAYAAQSIQQQWRNNLGVSVFIRQQSVKALRETTKGINWDMAVGFTQVSFSDPAAFLNIWNSDSRQNLAKYMNPYYDRLLNDAHTATGEALRMEKMHSAESLLIGQDMALIPLAYATEAFLVSPRLKGVVADELGQKYFMWAEVQKK